MAAKTTKLLHVRGRLIQDPTSADTPGASGDYGGTILGTYQAFRLRQIARSALLTEEGRGGETVDAMHLGFDFEAQATMRTWDADALAEHFPASLAAGASGSVRQMLDPSTSYEPGDWATDHSSALLWAPHDPVHPGLYLPNAVPHYLDEIEYSLGGYVETALDARWRALRTPGFPTYHLASMSDIQARAFPTLPSDVAGLAGWWKADAGLTLSGSSVTGWADQSGNGYDLSAVGTPTYVPQVASNGRPGILFDDATGEALEIDSNLGITDAPFTILVCAQSDDATKFQVAAYLGDKDKGNLEFHVVSFSGHIGGDPVGIWSRSSVASGAASSSTGYTVDTPHVLAGVFAGAAQRDVWIDNAGNVQNTTSSTPLGLDRFSVGRGADAFPGDYLSGHVFEVLAYNVALSTANRQALQTYLANKWGATLA